MIDQKTRWVRALGFLCLLYYIADVVNNIYFGHGPSWLLWYSSAGLLLTSVALLSVNKFLLSTAFSALFVIEAIWSVDFMCVLITGKTLFGLSNYVFAPSYSIINFMMSMYHLLIPASLALARLLLPYGGKYGWIGAFVYAGIIIFMTVQLAPVAESVNCLYATSRCQTTFSFAYMIPPPWRFIAALIVLVLFVYIPSNYVLLLLKRPKGRGSMLPLSLN